MFLFFFQNFFSVLFFSLEVSIPVRGGQEKKDEGPPVLVAGAGQHFSRIIHDDYFFPSMLLFISCKKHRDSVFATAECASR
jgi:hypothetical protein